MFELSRSVVTPPDEPADALVRSAFLHERMTKLQDGVACGASSEGWRSNMLVDESTFQTRLLAAGLSEGQFAALLDDPSPIVLPTEEFAGWRGRLAELSELLSQFPIPPSPDYVAGSAPIANQFWSFLSPFVHIARASLRERLSVDGIQLTEPIESGLVVSLLVRLAQRCVPTLVLELNVARIRGALKGTTPAERFRYFAEEQLRRRDALQALMGEYPVLYRLLLAAVDNWVLSSAELVSRLDEDAEVLAAEFGAPGGVSQVTALSIGLGDPHRRGRSVVSLTFASGARVIYKPRSMDVEKKFAEFIRRVNGLGLSLPLSAPHVAARGEYGWSEYVEHRKCESRGELAAFYRRLGSMVALLHLLVGVDFHYENLVACGTTPVLVDLEGLFHPRWARKREPFAYVRAQQWLENSVIGTGLLPHATAVQHEHLDLSGIGGRPGQMWPRLMPTVQSAGSDIMHIALQKVPVAVSRNRPLAENADYDASAFVDEIVEGFLEAHKLVEERRATFATLVGTFADAEVRHIPRPTARYALFLREGWHPDYLRDARQRDELLDKLWAEAEVKQELIPLVVSEQADLRMGDIPMFNTHPNSRDVRNSRGIPIKNYFDEPAIEVAKRRLASADPDERERQAALIRQAVLSMRGEAATPVNEAASLGSGAASAAELREAAIMIARRIRDRAIRGEEDACWIGPVMQRSEHWEWRLAPLGNGLYEGIGGPALLFGCLAALGYEEFDDIAARALAPLRKHLADEYPLGAISVGAFSGIASLAYVAGVLANIRRDQALLTEVSDGLARLGPHIDVDRNVDILSGVAGCAIVALGLYRETNDGKLLELAVRCGERLLSLAIPHSQGVGWISPIADQALGGFAHGAAGIAWALLEIETATADLRFGGLARQAIAYERSLFVPEMGEWVDKRQQSIPRGFKTAAWCHGAADVVDKFQAQER